MDVHGMRFATGFLRFFSFLYRYFNLLEYLYHALLYCCWNTLLSVKYEPKTFILVFADRNNIFATYFGNKTVCLNKKVCSATLYE